MIKLKCFYTCANVHLHTYATVHLHTCANVHLHTSTNAHLHTCANVHVKASLSQNKIYSVGQCFSKFMISIALPLNIY